MTETIESAARDDDRRPPLEARRRPRVHRAWIVAAVTFVTIIGGAA
ncbi:MFS transporter, partial [Streptomyces sp. SID8455]|nr:MFS transporter [Streptomyces sp. SID8455]